MHSLDLLPVRTYTSRESPIGYEDSSSSEGVPTPLEVSQSPSNFLNHPPEAPLSIDIPNKITQPLIGTPFITDSASLFEYPFPPVSSRPPLSSTSSSSSVASIPGPPSPATLDKHSSHVFARLSGRVGSPGHRKFSSHGGLSPIPIPPRLRKLSGGHILDESTPTRHDIPTPRFDLSPRADNKFDNLQGRSEASPNRDSVAARTDNPLVTGAYSTPRIIPGYELGPALSSTPRTCIDISITNRRRSMPIVLSDSDDEHTDFVSPGTKELTRLRF
ncbi:hypothetical protein OPQ81_005064 [Rhizoctonia solani]|nr:hypothetical protein OPQ81_005064 [Rhizoctonia solani]